MHVEREFSPELIYANLLETGDVWADAESAAQLLEETKRTVLAQLKVGSKEKSDAAKETASLANVIYINHVKEMVEARRVANHAKVRYDATKVLAEARRTESANRRAEQQFVQGGGASPG